MYFPGLNEQEKIILEQIIYRTSRSVFLQSEGLKLFFEATDANKNGFLEKNEVEKDYKEQNNDILKSLNKELEANKSNKLATENLKHTLEIYKKCGESLNERVKELVTESKLGNDFKISLDQLKSFYEKTYVSALKCLGSKDASLKVVNALKNYVDGFFKYSADDVKKDCDAKFSGCSSFEKILEKRKSASGDSLAFKFFDLIYYYIFYVYEAPEEELGSFFNSVFSSPSDFYETLKYFSTIIEIATEKLSA